MCASVCECARLPPRLLSPQVSDALNRRRNRRGTRLRNPPCAYITGLLVPKGGQITVDYQVRPCDPCGAWRSHGGRPWRMTWDEFGQSMRHHAAATQTNTMWRTAAAGRRRHIKRLPVGMA